MMLSVCVYDLYVNLFVDSEIFDYWSDTSEIADCGSAIDCYSCPETRIFLFFLVYVDNVVYALRRQSRSHNHVVETVWSINWRVNNCNILAHVLSLTTARTS